MQVKYVKRAEVSKKQVMLTKFTAIILALILLSLFLLALNFNPLSVYRSMIKGAFGSAYSIRDTITRAIPLVITALGITVAFKMQFWNIGGEGQIMMGAFGAALVALNLSYLSKPVLIILMFISGMLFAGIWALVPGFFKAKWNVNETIITLMMNYIAIKFVTYLQYGPWKDKSAFGFPKIPNFSDNAVLPKLFKVHIGWIIALVLAVIVYLFLNHTKKGYEISIIGHSEKTAVYAGINIKKTILQTIFISGILCGMAGVIQASGVSKTLSVEVSGGVGFTAIIIAWLAALNPYIIIVVSLLFAALVKGGSYIQTALGVPDAVAQILQSMILFFILGSEFFTKYKLVIKSKALKYYINKGGSANGIDS